MKVFLGGTCNGSQWREELMPKLVIEYFNPVVDDWNEEAMLAEEEAKDTSDYMLYVITPKMTGVYSIAEVVDASNKKPKNTILCILEKDGEESWDEHQLKSINQVKKMVESNGAIVLESLDDIADFFKE